MTKQRATIGDVARYAGVSKSTVSHVLNNTRFVSEETRQRVLQVIEEVGYRPSQLARGLASQRTNTVGLLVSDISNPFYPPVILGVEDVALLHGVNVFLSNVSYDLERIMMSIDSMIDRRVDGVICMSTRFSVEMLTELMQNHIPTVVLDWEQGQNLTASPTLGTLSIDFEPGIAQAVEHLIGLGHQCFAHISGPLDLWTSRQRRDVFIEALGRCDITPDQVVIIEGDLRVDGGRGACQQIAELKKRPTAIFAANDQMALGVLWEARKLGLGIPEQFSLTGLDNIPITEQITPALTTIALPACEIGERAMSMLLEIIESQAEDESRQTIYSDVIPTHLIIRETTAAAPIQE